MNPQNEIGDDQRDDRLALCEEKIAYRFQDKNLLRAALTHASGADCRANSNERLEFLGDAILGVVVCERLFQEFPDYQEGDLTKIKSVVVSRNTCTKISKQIELSELLILGKGLSNSQTVPDSLLADVFEALIAAIYLDGGMDEAKRFILRYVEDAIYESIENGTAENYKSVLQQFGKNSLVHLRPICWSLNQVRIIVSNLRWRRMWMDSSMNLHGDAIKKRLNKRRREMR